MQDIELEEAMLIGIDLGGSSAKMVLLNQDGSLVESIQLDFDPVLPMHWAEMILRQYQSWRSNYKTAPITGLSAPGLAAADQKSIAHMPGRLEGLVGLNWTEYLATDQFVPVLNDAQAAAMGEAWLGAARGLSDVVLLTLGTGVGGAVLSGGLPLKGRLGRAGHLGHISLDPEGNLDIVNTPGSLEMMIGNATINERTQGRFASTHDLVAVALTGDKAAQEIWEKSIRALAAAIASFINLFDPEIVLLGGGITRAGDALLVPLKEWINKFEWRPDGSATPIKLTTLGEMAGAYGAARNAWLGRQAEA